MPRVWKRKTDRVRPSEEELRNAITEALQGGSVRQIANHFNISKSSLSRHVQQARRNPGELYSYKPNTTIRQVFTSHQENQLAEYLKMSSKMHYGLTTTQARKLAYQYAVTLCRNVPDVWKKNETAGKEWLHGFMSRNHQLSIRTPEATSLSRSTSFNKFNVDRFYANIAEVYQRHNFSADKIWNCDETNMPTVHNPSKIISQKGLKQVGQITSAERGQLVTMLCFINAAGNTVPPAYVFPRKFFKEHMLTNGPPGSLGLAHVSGWMTKENFLVALKHFISHVKCSVDDPVVLFFDNHNSHVNLDVVEEARKHGVYLVTFPPHCSHRLQPLDVAVYGPLKAYYSQACNEWMTSNAGKTITIYNVAELSNKAFNLAFTKNNIFKAFQKTGIWPFEPNTFSEADFLMSAVTDRPNPCGSTNSQSDTASPSSLNAVPSTSATDMSPEFVRPYPKAGPRKTDMRGRKRGKTRILTDTPEKDELLADEQKRQVSSLKKVKVSKQVFAESSSDSDGSEVFQRSSDDSDEDYSNEQFDFDTETVKSGDFVVVKFATKKSLMYYVGVLLSDVNDEGCCDINFLRKSHRRQLSFVWPTVEDTASVEKENIVMKLPEPQKSGGTERTRAVFNFEVDLITKFPTIC